MFDDQFITRHAEELAPKLAALLLPHLKHEPVIAPEWLTRKQAAQYIGATPEAFRSMLRDGMFPIHAVKGRERIRRSDIDKVWLENKQYLKH